MRFPAIWLSFIICDELTFVYQRQNYKLVWGVGEETDTLPGNEAQRLYACLIHGIPSYGPRANFIRLGWTTRPARLPQRQC